MTREEEIKRYADELSQQYFPDESNSGARENIEVQFVAEACIRMSYIVAKHIEQELIKKACEWLKAHIKLETTSYADIWDPSDIDLLVADFTTVDEMIENFKKTIEE